MEVLTTHGGNFAALTGSPYAHGGLRMSLVRLELTHRQFRALLDWRMCSDPFPEGVDLEAISEIMEGVSKDHGYLDWVDAYHRHSA